MMADAATATPTSRLGKEKGRNTIFRWGYDRDKASLDILWLRDESLEESDNLPDLDILVQEIVEDLEAAAYNSAKSQWTWVARWWSPRKADLF